MPTVVNSYRLPDGVTVFEYDDGSKAYVHYLIPVDEAGNVITGGGGGTGGAATIADGADIAEGSKADTAATDTTGPWTVVSLLKGLLAAVKGTLAVTGTFWQAVQPVSGTFWQATQPVSVTSLPLPTGAAQDGTDATGVAAPAGATGIRGWLSSIYNKLNTSIAVTGTFWQAVQPVSGTFWQAKQPVSIADGDNTAQGSTGDTASASTVIGLLKAIKAAVQGSIAVTGTFWQAVQPVSGTFWQATQPVSVADGQDTAQGTTTDLATASTVIGLLKAIKAAVQSSIAVTGTFWQATQPVSGTFWQAKQPVSVADGDDTTQGAKADAANTATDTTAISAMSVWKQISKSVQAIATSVAGTLTATVSGTVTSNAGTNLNTSALALESGGNLAASKADLDTLAAAVASSRMRIDRTDRNVTGNLTAASGAGSTVAIDTTGMSTCYFSYSGTFSGLIIIEGFDGTAWVTNSGYILQSTEFTTSYAGLKNTFNSGNNKSSSAVFPCAGFQQIRARCTSWTSGSAAVILNAAAGEGPFLPKALVGYSGNVLQIGSLGEMYVSQKGVAPVGGRSTTNAFVDNPSDGETGTGLLAAGGMAWNGTNWDKIRNANQGIVLMSSASRTLQTGANLINYGWCGVYFVLNVTVIPGAAPALQFFVDEWGDTTRLLAASAAITATGAYSYYVCDTPATLPVGQIFVTQMWELALPGLCKVYLGNNGNAVTYSLIAYPIIRAN